MDEFSFIDSIKQVTYRQPTLKKGIGDDAAVFSQSTRDIVTAVDTFVDGVHFSRETMNPFHVGYRALAANISDLAAMGASPAFYLVSIVVPKTWFMEEIEEIFSGMKDIAGIYKLDLIGGDTVSGKELAISITVIGYVDKNKARYRSKAEAGDVVFVTGTLGDSQAGLYILTHPGNYKGARYYIKKHQMPIPRVAFAKGLSDLPRVALNDISDGIANEAAEIAMASRVDIVLDANTLPLSAFYKQFPEKLQRHWKLFGGEDFEIMGTVAKEDWPKVKKVAEQTKTPIAKIGYVQCTAQEANQVYLLENSQSQPLLKKGYIHMK